MKKSNKKEKINPIINNQKSVKNIKVNDKGIDDDEGVVKKFIIITIIIAVIIGIIYGCTELLKKDDKKTDDIVEGSINYDKISVGTLLNRPYDDYYVMVYSASDKDAVLYSTILTKYTGKSEEEKYTKIYFCDLDNSLNSPYYNVNDDNTSNPKATKIEDLDFGELTLLKIEKGKITKYVEDLEEIKDILK